MKGLKKFKHYISHNRILVFTIHPDVRNYVIQEDLGEGKASWITKIMEYDIEIKLTRLIRGRDLYENIAEASHMIIILEDEQQLNEESDWIKQIIFYFQTGNCPEVLDKFQRRRFKLHALRFIMIDDHLYRIFFYKTLLRCVNCDES